MATISDELRKAFEKKQAELRAGASSDAFSQLQSIDLSSEPPTGVVLPQSTIDRLPTSQPIAEPVEQRRAFPSSSRGPERPEGLYAPAEQTIAAPRQGGFSPNRVQSLFPTNESQGRGSMGEMTTELAPQGVRGQPSPTIQPPATNATQGSTGAAKGIAAPTTGTGTPDTPLAPQAPEGTISFLMPDGTRKTIAPDESIQAAFGKPELSGPNETTVNIGGGSVTVPNNLVQETFSGQGLGPTDKQILEQRGIKEGTPEFNQQMGFTKPEAPAAQQPTQQAPQSTPQQDFNRRMASGQPLSREEIAQAERFAKSMGYNFDPNLGYVKPGNSVDDFREIAKSKGITDEAQIEAYATQAASAAQSMEMNNAVSQSASAGNTRTPAQDLAERRYNLEVAKFQDSVLAREQANSRKPLTVAQKKMAEEAGKGAYEWDQGGRAGAKENIDKFQGVLTDLEDGNLDTRTLTEFAPLLGDWARAAVNPSGQQGLDTIRGVIFQGLRETLGAQFTEKEGERLVNASYNPKLSEADNIARLKPALKRMRDTFAAKEALTQHIINGGSIADYDGQTPMEAYRNGSNQSRGQSPIEGDIDVQTAADEILSTL